MEYEHTWDLKSLNAASLHWLLLLEHLGVCFFLIFITDSIVKADLCGGGSLKSLGY